jgi:mRNA interferase MazF
MGHPAGARPVLILTRDEGIAVRANITVAPLTTRTRGIPTEVPLGPEDSLQRPCVVDLDSLQTIPKSLLRERVATLSARNLRRAHTALRFALAMPADEASDDMVP